MHRILVDNESSIDILYHDAFAKKGPIHEQMVSTIQPLYGFTGDSIIPLRLMQLLVIVETHPFTATTMSGFLVIKGKSPYNVVIGRPTLRALKAVISIYHQTMKFPTARSTR